MEKVQAYLNHGRWLVDCPKHGKNGTLEVSPTTTEYVAPCCYPGVIATFMGVVNKQMQIVPDVSARSTAYRRAREAGEIYEVVFPEDMQEIMSVVSERPIPNQNWVQEETVEILQAENEENGVV